MANVQAQNYLKEVRDQYEDYPYPMRDPEDERKRLLTTGTSQLDRMVGEGFGGRLDLSQSFQVLIAGGGTGDSAMYLGEQLKPYPKAEIIYLDISQNSMDIAKKRAEIRGLNNIQFHHGSLLDVAKLERTFDLIECTGVLHHLASPLAGLKALSNVLKPNGVLSVMVYASYGRAGVYMVQDAMRQFAPIASSKQNQVDRCKEFLKIVPKGNQPIMQIMRSCAGEMQSNQDAGIYDLFLHPQDVSYTIPKIYVLAEEAKLHVSNFYSNYGEGGTIVYNPQLYINDPKLLQEVKQLPPANQHALAEILHGNMTRHAFHLTKLAPQKLDLSDKELIPSYNSVIPEASEKIMQIIRESAQQSQNAFHITLPPYGAKVQSSITPHLEALVMQVDGQKTFAQIYKEVIKQHPNATEAALAQEWAPFVSLLYKLNFWCFRYPGSPSFPKIK